MKLTQLKTQSSGKPKAAENQKQRKTKSSGKPKAAGNQKRRETEIAFCEHRRTCDSAGRRRNCKTAMIVDSALRSTKESLRKD